ncbi:MAG: DMT family transporter [Chitinophagaceae bacterium]|nr:DMT family transporter [Chitinophagaceae bacterium]
MRKAFFQLHIAVFLAGFTGILGKLITLNEGLLVWYRLLITVITLWCLYYFQKKIKRISRVDLIKITGVGIIAVLHWVSFYASIKIANVSVALVCFSSIGFFTAIMEPVILKHPVNFGEILLGILTIAGIYLIFHFDPKFKTGIIIGIISAFLGCLFPIFNRKFLRSMSSETVTLYELTGGFLFLSLIIPFYLHWFPSDTIIPGWSDFAWLLVLSWICTVVAFSLSMKALQKISAFTVNLTYNLEPLYGILLAFIFFREDKSLESSFYWGLSLIVLSVIIQTMLIYKARVPRIEPGER